MASMMKTNEFYAVCVRYDIYADDVESNCIIRGRHSSLI